MAYTAYPSKSPYGFPQVHSEGTNNYVHNGGENLYLRLAISSATADAEVLYTVPTNLSIMILAAFWEVTTGFTGGTSSAIGLSSSLSPHDAAGDILGGSAGDVAATLVAGYKRGTQGLSFTATPNLVVLTGGSTIKFNRITSAFTAGAGYVHLHCVTVAS
jgi:hypothetical protein